MEKKNNEKFSVSELYSEDEYEKRYGEPMEVLSDGKINKTQLDHLTTLLLSMENEMLAFRREIQDLWAVTGLCPCATPHIYKPASCGINISFNAQELWAVIPGILPHIQRQDKKWGKTVFYEEALGEEMKKIRTQGGYKEYKETLKNGYVVIFEFPETNVFNIRSRDVDNTECHVVVNQITTYLGVPDNYKFMSLYKTTKRGNDSITRVGVMSTKQFAKYIQNEVN